MYSNATLPQLVVFGTDYVLWPFYLYIWWGHYNPPFVKLASTGKVLDRDNQTVPYYKHVPKILESLTKQGIKIGAVARRHNLNATEDLIRLFGWEKYFSYTEFYKGVMRIHFENIHEKSGIEYSDMLYFDDILRNLEEAEKLLEVHGVLLQDGLNIEVFEQAMLEHRERKRRMID